MRSRQTGRGSRAAAQDCGPSADIPRVGYNIGALRHHDDRRHHADREILPRQCNLGAEVQIVDCRAARGDRQVLEKTDAWAESVGDRLARLRLISLN